MSLGTNWGLDLAINGNGWKQTANDDLIKSVCYLPLLAVVFRYLPTLLPYEQSVVGSTQELSYGSVINRYRIWIGLSND
jgi:hypothetical protein